MEYWVARQKNGWNVRISGPHYAVASAWDAHARIKATTAEPEPLVVVDENGVEQQRTEPKHTSY